MTRYSLWACPHDVIEAAFKKVRVLANESPRCVKQPWGPHSLCFLNNSQSDAKPNVAQMTGDHEMAGGQNSINHVINNGVHHTLINWATLTSTGSKVSVPLSQTIMVHNYDPTQFQRTNTFQNQTKQLQHIHQCHPPTPLSYLCGVSLIMQHLTTLQTSTWQQQPLILSNEYFPLPVEIQCVALAVELLRKTVWLKQQQEQRCFGWVLL